MIKNKLLTYLFIISSVLGITLSCYQKKAPKSDHPIITHDDDFLDDTLIGGLNLDSIDYVDTFELLPTGIIFKAIQNNSKQKTIYKLPALKSGDTLQSFEYIEQIAITNVYASIGKLSNNEKLFKTSLNENEDLFFKIIEDSISYPKRPTIDSLQNWTKQTFSDYTSQSEWAYYEAIQWLENLYLTIENPKNSKNSKKLEELVSLQLENGTEMLERLSAYQDYPPISVFTEYLIDIIDCKYFTFDVTQFKKQVIEARNNIYIPLVESTSK